MSSSNVPPETALQGMPEQPAGLDIGIRFLLTEFEYVRQFKEQSVAISDKRVDVELTLAYALGAGLALLSQTGIDRQDFLVVALFSVLILLAIGISTFLLVIDRDILIVDYIRASNRIRAYFAEHAPQIRPFLLMPTSHEYPPYGWQSSNRPVAMLVNAISLGAAATLVSTLLRHDNTPDFGSVVLGILYVPAAYFVQTLYAKVRYKLAEQNARSARSVSLFGSHETLRRGG